jgi:hypothetical protein
MTIPAFDRGEVERFATLPPDEAYPEGIDADADGNVYVVTVGANKPDTSPGSLFVFDPNGKLVRTVRIEGTSPWLLDFASNRTRESFSWWITKPEGLHRRSRDGRYVGVHDRYGRARRPRRVDG